MLAVSSQEQAEEITSGELVCGTCEARFPILRGVAVVVPDVDGYLLHHVKGVSKFVPDNEIPASIRTEFTRARKSIPIEHIEEDLESDRVNALYLMNHYLRVTGSDRPWWKSIPESESPLISSLIETHWDHGPFQTVSRWVPDGTTVVELGCGVGGLYRELQVKNIRYLGVDSSFLSVLIARHIHSGGPQAGAFGHPGDLLSGNFSKSLMIEKSQNESASRADFIVGEIDHLPVKHGAFEVSISLNAIDMLDEPAMLPKVQAAVTAPRGIAIQSGPYIWHETVARRLRGRAPKHADSSARAVEWLYEKSGFAIEQRELHVPWLFFKHLRQLEIYSVHCFSARKRD